MTHISGTFALALIAIVLVIMWLPEPQAGTNPAPMSVEQSIAYSPPSIQVMYYTKLYTDHSSVKLNHALRCLKQETSYSGWSHFAYNPYSNRLVSVANAVGPMQVTVIAARDVWGDRLSNMKDVEVLKQLRFNIKFNIQTGIKYLENLYKYVNSKYPNQPEKVKWAKVYSMYNQGQVGEHSINSYAINIVR